MKEYRWGNKLIKNNLVKNGLIYGIIFSFIFSAIAPMTLGGYNSNNTTDKNK